jgi:hypothetical protein
MDRIFLAIIISGLLLFTVAVALLLLPDEPAAMLVRPLSERVSMKPDSAAVNDSKPGVSTVPSAGSRSGEFCYSTGCRQKEGRPEAAF